MKFLPKTIHLFNASRDHELKMTEVRELAFLFAHEILITVCVEVVFSHGNIKCYVKLQQHNPHFLAKVYNKQFYIKKLYVTTFFCLRCRL